MFQTPYELFFLASLRHNFGKWTMIQWQTGAFHSFTSFSFRVGVSHLPCMCGFWHWIVGLWFFWQAWINTSPSLALWWLSLMDGELERALEGNSTNANLKGPPPPQLALSTPSCCFFSQLNTKIIKNLKIWGTFLQWFVSSSSSIHVVYR